MKGYLANGLFSLSDIFFNDYLAGQIRGNFTMNTGENLDLYVPQENAEINNKHSYADSKAIAKADTEKLLEADFLVAVIDGPEIDSGVAAEIGIFSTTGRPILALYTDVRQKGRGNQRKIDALIQDGTENQFMYRNLFVIGVIKQNGQVFDDITKLQKAILEVYNNG
jgi:nucleoside 2-deoxyribosyltransferase